MSDDVHWTEEFWAIVNILAEDARKCIGVLDLTEDDEIEAKVFWRRMLARATFALIDDIVYRFMATGLEAIRRDWENTRLRSLKSSMISAMTRLSRRLGAAPFPKPCNSLFVLSRRASIRIMSCQLRELSGK